MWSVEKFHARHMMIVVEKRHFATMACAIRVINVKIAMTESTEHEARAEQLHQETHVVTTTKENRKTS